MYDPGGGIAIGGGAVGVGGLAATGFGMMAWILLGITLLLAGVVLLRAGLGEGQPRGRRPEAGRSMSAAQLARTAPRAMLGLAGAVLGGWLLLNTGLWRDGEAWSAARLVQAIFGGTYHHHGSPTFFVGLGSNHAIGLNITPACSTAPIAGALLIITGLLVAFTRIDPLRALVGLLAAVAVVAIVNVARLLVAVVVGGPLGCLRLVRVVARVRRLAGQHPRRRRRLRPLPAVRPPTGHSTRGAGRMTAFVQALTLLVLGLSACYFFGMVGLGLRASKERGAQARSPVRRAVRTTGRVAAGAGRRSDRVQPVPPLLPDPLPRRGTGHRQHGVLPRPDRHGRRGRRRVRRRHGGQRQGERPHRPPRRAARTAQRSARQGTRPERGVRQGPGARPRAGRGSRRR